MIPNCNTANDSDYQNHPSLSEESSRSLGDDEQKPLATIFSHHHNHRSFAAEASRSHTHEQPPLMTIFFDESLRLSDLLARDLPLVAPGKMDEAMKPSYRLETQLCGAINLSMKRSLKSFLQKRKLRIQATSPYTIKDLVKAHQQPGLKTANLKIEIKQSKPSN